MKLLLIAPESFQKPEIPYFICEIFTPTSNLERDIESIKNVKADLIIIPAEQSATYFESHLLGGLELLVWLRIKSVDTHIVVTSFSPLQSVLQKTKLGFIFGSKGVSFHQIPKRIANDYLQNSVKDKVEDKNLKSYLSAMFDKAQFRHAYANIWGLKRLVEAHNEIFHSTPFIFDNTSTSFRFEENSTIKSLNYNIGQFIFQTKSKADKQTKEEICCQLAYLKEHKGLNILYIDDKADQGWLEFLQFLFHKTVKIHTLNLGTKEDNNLYEQFELLVDELGCIDFIISDLRLYPAEDNINDYDQFISIKLMKQIFDARIPAGRLKYLKLNYLLFTASNQILSYKTTIGKNEYAPSALFIKEGFDIQNNVNQKYSNFLNLLESLNQIAIKRYRIRGNMFEAIIEVEEEKIADFKSKLNNKIWGNDIHNINEVFDKFTHIILDTNLYLEDEPILPLTNHSKIFLTYPVYKELNNIQRKKESSLRVFLSTYFVDQKKSTTEGLTQKDIACIDKQFKENSNLNDLADRYFQQIILHFSKNKENKILFVTNDITSKNGNKDPYNQIYDWIKKEKKSNVFVDTFFDKKFKNKY